jgi:HAMP domain-containing protein
MKKISIPFQFKIGLSIFFLSVGLISFSTFIFINQIQKSFKSNLSQRLINMGSLGQHLITSEMKDYISEIDKLIDKKSNRPSEKLKTMKKGDSIKILEETYISNISNNPKYIELIQILRKIKYSTSSIPLQNLKYYNQYIPGVETDIHYVYILSKIDESEDYQIVKFIADCDNEEIDMNQNGFIDKEEIAVDPGDLYHIGNEKGISLALSGKFGSSESYQEDKWGTWYSGFVPILDSNNKVIAVLGIDIDASNDIKLIREFKNFTYLVVLLAILLSLVVSIFISKKLSKPLSILIKATENIRNREYVLIDSIVSKDEFGKLASSFNQMSNEIKNYSINLENMVKIRTEELSSALSKVKDLNYKQDADYYLTTIILEPLIQNKNNHPYIKTEFYIEQFKKFRFHKYNKEIGGDTCITGNIKLKNNGYVFFFNGDAMGKSLQGAGGSLVIGSIINSILARTMLEENNQNITPNEWLTNLYLETQRIFETFDGLMLISCITGLIDEKNKNLSFFNSDHPNLLLMRDNIIKTIESSNSIYKIGLVRDSYDLPIINFQLQKGDILLLGSDGREDIKINGEIIQKKEIISEYFLKNKGNLIKTIEELKSSAELTDDLSLIKISIEF